MYKVMIVDNEDAIRNGLVNCIRWETLGCEVPVQACDGIDALDQFRKSVPDILISDIRMPGMDGMELSDRVSAEYPHTKIIILTGFPDFDYAQRAIQYHVVDFVLKPTSVEGITKAIEKAKQRLSEESSTRNALEKLKDTSEQNLNLQKSLLVYDLIQRNHMSQLYVLNRMAQLGIDFAGYYLLRLDITETEAGPQQSSLLAQVQSVLQDAVGSRDLLFVPCGDASCYAPVCVPENFEIQDKCEETISIARSMLKTQLYIGISRYTDDAMKMAGAAAEANQAVQFSRYFSECTAVRFESMPQIPQEITDRIFRELRSMQASVNRQDPQETEDILKRLFATVRKNHLPIEAVRNICLHIHQFCSNLLFRLNTDENYFPESGMDALHRLMQSETVDDMESCMTAFTAHMFDRTDTDPVSTDNIIRSIKAYISEHYAEDFSLTQISEHVYLSPSYLSKLFKRKTGENLSNYLQNFRIEQARVLLKTTDLKTYEIAEKTGIPDPVYFSRIFKKLTGLKPKDYRNG